MMERLTYRCDDGLCGGEYRVNEQGTERSGPSVDRLAAYEDTGLEPEVIYKWKEALSKLTTTTGDRILEIANAEREGRLLVLDDNTVLALAAGARAMENNPRLYGASYEWDVFGKHGGPKDISYYEAAKRLREISAPIMASWCGAVLPDVVE